MILFPRIYFSEIISGFAGNFAGSSLIPGISGSSSVGIDGTGKDLLLLIIYVLLALLISFLCSIAEAVLLSVTPQYIERLKEKSQKQGSFLEKVKQDKVDQSLAAILTLNTIAHTVGAIGAGAKATLVFGNAWFGLFSALITLMILFLSEIIPKTIGAIYWPKLAGITGYFVYGLIILLYPIVWISEKLTKMIARGRNIHLFSREEFLAMAKVGEKTGNLQRKESGIIKNLFRFEHKKITEIMTPRTVIEVLPEQMKISQAVEKVSKSSFSRLPVYLKNIDDLTGFVLKDEVLIYEAKGKGEVLLSEVKRELLVVPESLNLSRLMEKLLHHDQHIANVVDEFGGTKGLVTLEDLLETLLGTEIVDETDDVEDMQILALNKSTVKTKIIEKNQLKKTDKR
jgi:CBS domain containing-hemolysin-like protein